VKHCGVGVSIVLPIVAMMVRKGLLQEHLEIDGFNFAVEGILD